MKIIKYLEYIKENLTDTPESYIASKLKKLKNRLDKIFDYYLEDDADKIINTVQFDNIKSEDLSFKDMGVILDSSEISKYSALYDSLTVKFSDEMYAYTLIVMIDIKEGIPKGKENNFGIDDVKKAYVKFKKYDLDDFDLIGQIDKKDVNIKDIDEKFLIDLKIEIDKDFDDEDFEIETN